MCMAFHYLTFSIVHTLNYTLMYFVLMEETHMFTSNKYVLPYITAHQHVTVASATITRVPYQNTDSTHKHTTAQNEQLKPSSGTFNILGALCACKVSNYVIIRNRQNWACLCCCTECCRPAFLKLWSADHKWSSGSALVVLLD